MVEIVVKGKPLDYLESASGWFDYNCLGEWFQDETVKKIVKDIDQTEVINASLAISPVLGSISVKEISGGAKGLILISKDEDKRAFSSTIFGDNCVGWLARLSFEVDFVLVMEHALGMKGTQSINAVGENGELLKTCGDVGVYYLENCSPS